MLPKVHHTATRAAFALALGLAAFLFAGCFPYEEAPYGHSYSPGGYVPASAPPRTYSRGGSSYYGHRDSPFYGARHYGRSRFAYDDHHHYDRAHPSSSSSSSSSTKKTSSASTSSSGKKKSPGTSANSTSSSNKKKTSSGSASSTSSSSKKKSSSSTSASKPTSSDRRYRAPNPKDEGLRGRRSQVEAAKKKKG
ncbi:hypothetical protein BH23VER1_BH23VER1_16520 [soil metagenome]